MGERWAVTAAFVMNGAAFATWAPRIPAVQDRLGLDAASLGLALSAGGLGGLLFTHAAGRLADRFGSRRTLIAAVIALTVCLPLLGLAPAWWAFAVTMLLLGAADALMDVSMNAHAVHVERRAGRSLLNGFHAAWSIGAVAGGLLGSAAAAFGVPVALHLLAVVTAGGAVTLSSLLSGTGHAPPIPRKRPTRSRPAPALLLLGVIVLVGAFIEDVPNSWSAVYLTDSLGAGPGPAGLALVAFLTGMTAGRMAGNRLVDRFGPTAVLTGGGLLAALACLTSLAVGSPAAAIAGFAVIGLGASPIFPTVFSLAGRYGGDTPGAAVAVVSLVSRVGFLIAPFSVGLLVDWAGFPWALSVVAVAALTVTLLAGLLRSRGPAGETEPPSPARQAHHRDR